MVWVKVDDTALASPRWLELHRVARLLHLEALSWSNRHGADGVIPRTALAMLTDEPDAAQMVAVLVEAGAWVSTDTGWQLVWLLEDQPTAEEQEHERANWRDRKDRNRRHHRGDHSRCNPDWCPVSRRDSQRDSEEDTKGDSRVESRPPDPTPPPTRPAQESGSVADGARANEALPSSRPREEQIADALRLLGDPEATPESRRAAEKALRLLESQAGTS